MLIQSFINALGQLLLFSLIPFIYWFISLRRKEGFLQWIGLKRPSFHNKAKVLLFSAISFALLLISGLFLVLMVEDRSVLANAKFSSMGIEAVFPIFCYSVIQTALSEEILFRGFLLKFFSQIWGISMGNFIQSILFGLLHGMILFPILNPSFIILVILFSTLAGWIMGYINEYLGNGSIVPSWIIHSLMNICSSLLIAFNLL
ncbi:CPBP family intramembrane glutamic endopeptidase [Tetragenococcus solitarius]|nr:type II CAAX endopeptidase family protein [Tetragenococcus solitarius]